MYDKNLWSGTKLPIINAEDTKVINYKKALELFDSEVRMKKVKGYPDCFRRYHKNSRQVAIHDEVNKTVTFFKFLSHIKSIEVKDTLFNVKPDKKPNEWDYLYRDINKLTHGREYHFCFLQVFEDSTDLNVGSGGTFALGMYDHNQVNSPARNWFYHMFGLHVYRHNTFDYLQLDGKYYCTNYQGVQVKNGVVVNSHPVSNLIIDKKFKDVDLKDKYRLITKPYIDWLRSVVDTCTDNEIPAFEFCGVLSSIRKGKPRPSTAYNKEEILCKEFEKIYERLVNKSYTDEDFVNLTCLFIPENPMQIHPYCGYVLGDRSRHWQYGNMRLGRVVKSYFFSMDKMIDNVIKFFIVNKEDIFKKVEQGKRAWDCTHHNTGWVLDYHSKFIKGGNT